MLDKTTYKIMSIVYRAKNIEELKLRENFKRVDVSLDYRTALDQLVQDKLVLLGKSQNDVVYRLTPKGEGEFLQQRRSDVEFRLTQVFAVMGTVTGVAGTIIGIIALLN